MQTVTPYLYYVDADAALRFLSEAFGFEETLRYTGPDGFVGHAEMRIGDGTIMLGDPGDEYRNPDQLGGRTQGVHVYVPDVDALCEQARAAGAEIVGEPADKPYGDRQCTVRDPEGHEWFISKHLQDVDAADWGASVS
jgi:PhnB protein